MILISFSIALIAIVFGAKLLAQSQKESLGVLYKYLAWFIIAMGFCVLLCDGARGLLRCANMGRGGMMRKEIRMNRGDGMMGGGPIWMNHCNGGNMNCCMGNNCCDGMSNCGDNSNCHDGMMNCPDGGANSSCKGGMPANCPMMGGMKCKADSGKMK